MNSSEDMLDLVLTVSRDLPPEAERLFREDPESLETYLASEAFLEALLEHPAPLSIDAAPFFYVLFRQFQRRLRTDAGFRERFRTMVRRTAEGTPDPQRARGFFDDRELIGYLVELLRGFVRREDVYQLPGDDEREYRYVFEMLEASLDSDEHETFQIYRQVGDYSLYLTGLFPDWLRHRHRYRHRPMDVDSYRNYGKAFYERAANHRQAENRQLRRVLTKLHRGYDLVRSAVVMIFRDMLPAVT